MPEGHTIHRLALDHRGWFAGERVTVSSPQGRFAGAGEVDGQRFVDADAWGKHLFHEYEDGRLVHVHLGLFGRFWHHLTPPPPPRDTVRMRVATGGHVVDLVGATACDLVTPGERDDLVSRLGPDPIRTDADPERAWQALQRRRIPIGRALMDQTVLAGVGNVYRAEVLFVHGVHPELPARDLPRETWDAMWRTLVRWMRRGVRERRIITTRAIDLPGRRRPTNREESVHVYKRDACRRCETPIRRWKLADRWAYACESCQPRPDEVAA